ncbi:hypothetical protein IFM89_038539 [Coptis chinensis]|uniref:Cytochrome P450 n=1 Tax=Coptis chinensis TaxID=261450 RepID=A0A835H370_9MAGN|nr:hypothetical protein IFM89_038539 [Coptis chinensis]
MTEIFSSLGKGSFFVDGGFFSNLRYIVTCHPQNLEYILKTNFDNFPKGSDFNEVFDLLGDGIFNADNELWRSQRKVAHGCFSSANFRNLVAKSTRKVIEDQLVPFFAHVAKEGTIIDLQDVCKRFAFDSNMGTILGGDEKYLSIGLPVNELADAVDDAQEAIFYRHVIPKLLWKFLRLLSVGRERKLARAWKSVDVSLGKYISQTRENLLRGVETSDLLSMHIKSQDELFRDDKFLRDAMLNLFIAGRDTIASGLIWFLWLVVKTPRVQAKILYELELIFSKKNNELQCGGIPRTKTPVVFDSEDLKGLVYLHAALCESLRLYPPLPLNSKAVLKEDVLPDGTRVKPGMQIILSFYSEGKMPWIWGEDSLEFKPERWINEEGKLKHEPFSKFFVFNAGPRTCIGKDISFTQMKAAVAAILFNFSIELVEHHPVCPKPFINLHMKYGLLVRIIEK